MPKKKVTFIGSFFDPPKPGGGDRPDRCRRRVIMRAFGVIEAAAKKISHLQHFDQSSLAPDTASPARSGTCIRPSPGDQAGEGRRVHRQDTATFRAWKGGSTSRPTAPSKTKLPAM